jgi:hypothetical protein
LAEIYMRDFDLRARRLPGVYYYARYVDDVLLMSSRGPIGLKEQVESLLKLMPTPLRLNEKTETIDREPGDLRPVDMVYLGYQFTRAAKRRDEAKVTLRIAPKKILRLERRVRSALHLFAAGGSFADLVARIRILTGNYELERSGHSDGIMAGLRYSYPDNTDKSQLPRLDAFFRREVASLRRKLAAQGDARARMLGALRRYSFTAGFEKGFGHNFSRSELERLTALWKNVH